MTNTSLPMATAPATTSTTAPATNPIRLPKNNLTNRDLPMSSTSEINAALLRLRALVPNVPSRDDFCHSSKGVRSVGDQSPAQVTTFAPGAARPFTAGCKWQERTTTRKL